MKRETRHPRVIKSYEFPTPPSGNGAAATPGQDARPKVRRGPRNRKEWSAAEDRTLRRNYTRQGAPYTAELLGRTITSVQARALRLGIAGRGYNAWSEMEIRYLRKNYGRRSAEEIARTLQRTEGSVRGKIHLLGLGSYRPEAWTKEDEKFLRTHYRDMTNVELGRRLGRTEAAIELKAGRLKLRRPLVKLTARQKQWVIEHLGNLSYETMAAELGVSHSTIMKIAHANGYRPRPNIRDWTARDDAYLRRHYGTRSRQEIALALDRSVPLVTWRAGKLGLTRDARNRDRMRPWTPKEDRYLMRSIGRRTHREIAEKLERTVPAVSGRVAALRRQGLLNE